MHLDPNQSLHLLLKLVLCLFSLGSELAVPFVNGQLTASSVSFTQSGHLSPEASCFLNVCVRLRASLERGDGLFPSSSSQAEGKTRELRFMVVSSLWFLFFLNPVPPVRSLAAHALL